MKTIIRNFYFNKNVYFSCARTYCTQKPGHSAQYLDDTRLLWWDFEQLNRIKVKYKLDSCTTVLDIGAGHGHWTRVISSMVNKNAEIFTLDKDKKWVEHILSNSPVLFSSQKISSHFGQVEKIPFNNNLFDLVTCQTLLIHVPDPKVALKEMIRVTKKPGKLLFAEPCNMASIGILNSVTKNMNREDYLKIVDLYYTCERGKINLGEGDISLGSSLLQLLSKEGLSNISITLADKVNFLLPPYNTKEQQEIIRYLKENIKKGNWIWDKDKSKEYFIAGKGEEEQFNIYWKTVEKVNDEYYRAIMDNEFIDAGGQVMYLCYAEILE